jgi:hypothetical protein
LDRLGGMRIVHAAETRPPAEAGAGDFPLAAKDRRSGTTLESSRLSRVQRGRLQRYWKC